MSAYHDQAERKFFTRWVRGTFGGWLLGFVFILLGAIAGDLLGMGESESQFIVGVAMGAGVGYAQGRVARQWFGATWRWTWASVIGMGVPFLASDFLGAVWGGYSFSLPLVVVIGALLVGFLQREVLRSHSNRANWWVPACVAGWTLAAATAAVSGVLASGPSAQWLVLLRVAVILLGGVVLGTVTGGTLVWMLRR